jgi:hypothetical protein
MFEMSLRENERLFAATCDDHVLSFREWCELNRFSLRTGRRIIDSSNGPAVLRLAPRRIGITVAANRRWQAARVQT